jgi:hypothetical protein
MRLLRVSALHERDGEKKIKPKSLVEKGKNQSGLYQTLGGYHVYC